MSAAPITSARIRPTAPSMAENPARIVARNVNVSYGDKQAIFDVSMDIPEKSVTAFIGPSGCGKSTFLRCFNRMNDTIDICRVTGDITIDGKRVNDLDPKDRDVAMVFQSYALYPNLDVYENIRFPLKVRKSDPAEHDARVRRAAEMVELTEFLHRRPAELSGGQRQRVAIARMLLKAPTIMVFDEATSSLDSVSEHAILQALDEVSEQHTTLVIAHRLATARRADVIHVLEQGRIAQVFVKTLTGRPSRLR